MHPGQQEQDGKAGDGRGHRALESVTDRMCSSPRAVGSHSGSEADECQIGQLYKKIHSAFGVENGLSGVGARARGPAEERGADGLFQGSGHRAR